MTAALVKERIANFLAHIPPGVRRAGLLAIWVGGLFLIAGLFWHLTQPARNQVMVQSVNEVLALSGANFRLDSAYPSWGQNGRVMQTGTWFSISNSEARAVVFPVMSSGILTVVLAVINREGVIETLIPISGGAVKAGERLPPETFALYASRIESGNALVRRGEP
ncbi:hypothetical protein FACS189493_0790 [Spirochaetia bacterium]|nr:hypothetical protein FACS189493_0790 [Spirochaetia bacterium]